MYARVAPRQQPVDRAAGRPGGPGCPTTRCRGGDPHVGPRPARPGRIGVLTVALDHDHRREVAGLLEPAPGGHVRGGVGTEHEEQLAVGRGQRLERVGGHRRRRRGRPRRATPTARGSTRPRARSCARGPRRTRRHGRASATGRPRVRAAPRRARARRARRPRRRRARGGPGRRCHRGHRGASPRRFYGRLHDGSVTSSVHSGRRRARSVGCARESLPRVDPGPRPGPPGRARARRVAHRRGQGRHRRHRGASTATTAPRSTSSSVILPDARPDPHARTRDRRGRRRRGRRRRGRRRVPRAPARRGPVRAGARAGPATSRRSRAILVERVVALVRPDWCQARGPGVAVGTDARPDAGDRDRHRVDRAPGLGDHALVRRARAAAARRAGARRRVLRAGRRALAPPAPRPHRRPPRRPTGRSGSTRRGDAGRPGRGQASMTAATKRSSWRRLRHS